ncbi:MAG: 23S rRNA (guanosine(2251)-2'-O)-methyltransferase RlmB [Magnetospirillum sp.]|nr:23S rRNA (guanosine(2251)-2'-O)-methyltransferase RlmB [Magnetospirillum sp.]
MTTRDPRANSAARQGGRHNRNARPAGRETQAARPPSGTYWLAGTHAVIAALENPKRRIRRLLTTDGAAREMAERIASLRAGRPLPPEEIVDKPELERLLPAGTVHQGIAALVEPLASPSLEDIGREGARRERAVVVVLDQVTDPHNVGACLRSAAAFGAMAVIVPDRHAPEETASLAKAASGALERLPLVRVTNVVRALEDLKAAGFWVAGLAADGSATLAEAGLSGRVVLVLGAEGEGLRRLTREHCDHLVRLPMTGAVESLNVSNAAAVALYELVRAEALPR